MKEKSKEPGQTISLPDGRKLGYLIIGEGKPVIFFPGHPGSRLHGLFLGQMPSSRHLQIISVDRPGFGLSTYHPNRRLCDVASEVAFLADELGIDKFSIIGFSHGGIPALTCAPLLSKRLTRVVVTGAWSLPPDTPGQPLDLKILNQLYTVPILNTLAYPVWTVTGIVLRNSPKYHDALVKPWIQRLSKKLGARYFSEDDAAMFIASSEIRDVLLRSEADAFRQGPDAIKTTIQEFKLRNRGWDVDLSQIPPGLVHIWHGDADNLVPVKNAYKNAEAIPGAHLKIFKGEGHLCMINHLEELGELLSS